MKSIASVLLLLLSSVASAVTYDCGAALYRDGQPVANTQYQLEYSGTNLLIIAKTKREAGFPELREEISTLLLGRQQVGGVFNSSNGAYTVYVDPSEVEAVKLRFRKMNSVAWAICVISPQQSKQSFVYSLLHSAEVRKAAVPIIQEFNRVAGRTVLQSLDNCSDTTSLYAAFPEVTMKDLVYQDLEQVICPIYRHFYEGSAFGDVQGRELIQKGYELCDQHIKDVPRFLNSIHVTPYKKAISHLNSLICDSLNSIRQAD